MDRKFIEKGSGIKVYEGTRAFLMQCLDHQISSKDMWTKERLVED